MVCFANELKPEVVSVCLVDWDHQISIFEIDFSNQSPGLNRSHKVWMPSILKCSGWMNWFRALRLITGLCPPLFLGTRNMLEQKPVSEGYSSSFIACFWMRLDSSS